MRHGRGAGDAPAALRVFAAGGVGRSARAATSGRRCVPVASAGAGEVTSARAASLARAAACERRVASASISALRLVSASASAHGLALGGVGLFGQAFGFDRPCVWPPPRRRRASPRPPSFGLRFVGDAFGLGVRLASGFGGLLHKLGARLGLSFMLGFSRVGAPLFFIGPTLGVGRLGLRPALRFRFIGRTLGFGVRGTSGFASARHRPWPARRRSALRLASSSSAVRLACRDLRRASASSAARLASAASASRLISLRSARHWRGRCTSGGCSTNSPRRRRLRRLEQRLDDLVAVRAVGARQPVAHHLDEAAPSAQLARRLFLRGGRVGAGAGAASPLRCTMTVQPSGFLSWAITTSS